MVDALLNGAADSFRTVQVTYCTWRHEQRLPETFRDHIEKQIRRGVSTGITASAVRSGGPNSGVWPMLLAAFLLTAGGKRHYG